ncbi:MAG: hypothetical protein ABIQ35_00195 [Verrucomicrobiota bacterium]
MHAGLLKIFLCTVFSLAFSGSLFAEAVPVKDLTEDQRIHIALEALSRLRGSEVAKDPQIKIALDKLVTRTRGTPQFLALVKQLGLKDQDAGLLELAKNSPASESGVEATRLLLSGDQSLLKNSLEGSDAAKITEALGNTGMKEAVPLLLPIVTSQRDLDLRKLALRSATRTLEGADEIFKLVRQEKLPADLKLTATSELNGVRWGTIKTDAAALLPLPQSHEAKALPSVADLVKMKGDPAEGERVFFRPETQCSTCHKIKERGIDVGPALTEIGAKLGKDALFESILEPSAGISFGFEATQVDLKSGDEAYGLVVSDTTDEVVMKDLKGIISRYKKNEIVRRQQLKMSIMPAGLQQTMSAQEFVDLVEFLSSLRKAN